MWDVILVLFLGGGRTFVFLSGGLVGRSGGRALSSWRIVGRDESLLMRNADFGLVISECF